MAIVIGQEILSLPKVMGTIRGGTATLSPGDVQGDDFGKLAARRLLTSITIGKSLKMPLRFELADLMVKCR